VSAGRRPLCALAADRDGTVLDAPPLAHEIAADPVLADRRIVAAPADTALLPRLGTRGFPHWATWSERPAGFAADVIRFLAEGEAVHAIRCNDRTRGCSL
jgi:glycogen operon protein